jgi:hypothetical protein
MSKKFKEKNRELEKRKTQSRRLLELLFPRSVRSASTTSRARDRAFFPSLSLAIKITQFLREKEEEEDEEQQPLNLKRSGGEEERGKKNLKSAPFQIPILWKERETDTHTHTQTERERERERENESNLITSFKTERCACAFVSRESLRESSPAFWNGD